MFRLCAALARLGGTQCMRYWREFSQSNLLSVMKLKSLLKGVVAGVWVVAALAMLAVAAYYLLCHHMSPLSRDQWHMYAAMLQDGLWQTSLTTFSGHRHLFAFSLFWLDWHYFSGRNYLLAALAWLLNGLLAWLLCRLVWREGAGARWLLLGTVLLLQCWLVNLALLGWGFNGINNYLAIVPSVWALYCLLRAEREQSLLLFMLAAALGLVATLSFGSGIIVWPAGLLLLWGARATPGLLGYWLAALALALALYLLLPGGEVVNASLRFSGWFAVSYLFEQQGGPFYHLLRAWPWIDNQLAKSLANAVGYVIGVCSLWLLFRELLWRRRLSSYLLGVGLGLQLLGWGTLLLLTLTRQPDMLDTSIDRFQIWALLVWLGVLLCLWQRSRWRSWLVVLALLFPLAALPSQLDWGARLAEYKNRVDQGLLSWVQQLPLRADAERALHWNWQQKVVPMTEVLAQLRAADAGSYREVLHQNLGQVQPIASQDCSLQHLRVQSVTTRELWPEPVVDSAADSAVVGWRVYAEYAWQADDRALLLDDDRRAVGLALPVVHSRLPRANGRFHTGHNLYGLARSTTVPAALLILRRNQPVCLSRLVP